MIQSQAVEQRKHPRVPLNRKALILFPEHVKIQAKIRDISIVGGGLLLSRPVKTGVYLKLLFRLPSMHGLVEVKTMCLTTHCRLQKDVYYVGIEFQEMKPELVKEIHSYVSYKLK